MGLRRLLPVALSVGNVRPRGGGVLSAGRTRSVRPIVKKIASAVVLTLAAATAAGSVALPSALAGALPAAPATAGVSAPRALTQAPQLVRAPGPGNFRVSATSGAQLWVRRYNGPGNNLGDDDVARSEAVSPDGSTVYVTGYSQGTISDEYTTIAYSTTTGAQLWVSKYNDLSNYGAEANSVAVSPDGHTVFVTGSDNAASNGEDYVTVAYNAATGAQLWVSRYDGAAHGNDTASKVAVSPDGGTVYVTGWSIGTSSIYYYDWATVAYNAVTGAQLWVRRYSSQYGTSGASAVAVSPDGGTVFVTGFSHTATSDDNYVTIAYNAATGASRWLRRYNGPENSVDQSYAVTVSPDGSTLYIAGASIGSTGAWDYAILAYNAATGAQRWVRRYNGPANGTDQAHAVAVSPDGGTVYVTGFSDGVTSAEDYLTVAYNAVTGAQRWVRRYNGPGNGTDEASSVAISPGGGTVYATGHSAGVTSGDDYATVAYNAATGAHLWVRRYNGPANGTDQASAVAVSPATGAVFITGYSNGSTSGEDYLSVAYNG
jgi:DNA-binding beta-propeller fold protein YncE